VHVERRRFERRRHDRGGSWWQDPWVRVLVILLTIIAAIYLFQTVWLLLAQIGDLLILFVLGWLISFVLEPAVAGLTRWMSRPGSVLVISLGALIALLAAGVIVLPELATQSAGAAEQSPLFFERVRGWWFQYPGAFLTARGVPVETYTEQVLRSLQAVGPSVAGNVVLVATGAAAALAQIFLVFILSLYFMIDSPRLGAALLASVPNRYRDDFTFFVSSVYRAFGGFLRGQIIQATIYGAGTSVVLLLTGMPFVALGGVTAGVLMFIPFLGPPLAMIPALLVVLTFDVGRFFLVMIPMFLLNILVVNVVAPKVMSESIGLHPIVVLASLLVGARVGGGWGALFAVPVAAVIAAMVAFYQLTFAERKQVVADIVESTEEGSPQEVLHASDEEVGEPLVSRATDVPG